MRIMNRFLGMVFILASFSGFGRDLQAPFPFQTESAASSACVSRMQQLHDIVNSFFLGVPASTTLKRNDVIIPFIQTDSVFAPLSNGKKTVKYQVVGSYIQSPDTKYQIFIETDDDDSDARVEWSSADFYVNISPSFENTCSQNADPGAAYFTISLYDEIQSLSFTMPIINFGGTGVAAFCADPSVTIASKINAATVSGHNINPGGSIGSVTSSTQNDAFKASVLAKTKNATIASLCSIWGY